MIDVQLLSRHALVALSMLAIIVNPAVATTPAPAVAEQIHISGAVLQPGDYEWRQGARLRDATVAGQVSANAWPLGAALLRQQAVEPQRRLKAGVLFDLQVNSVHAMAGNNPALQQLTKRLHTWVSDMPATGRVVAELNPFQLLLKSKNALLEPGDELIYPTRPASIQVLGAVSADCQLPFSATLKLKDYLKQCPAHPAADPSFVYLIQPNGATQKVGIAHWNQQRAVIAVGGLIYRPLKSALMAPDTSELNQDIAALLATQYRLGGNFK